MEQFQVKQEGPLVVSMPVQSPAVTITNKGDEEATIKIPPGRMAVIKTYAIKEENPVEVTYKDWKVKPPKDSKAVQQMIKDQEKSVEAMDPDLKPRTTPEHLAQLRKEFIDPFRLRPRK